MENVTKQELLWTIQEIRNNGRSSWREVANKLNSMGLRTDKGLKWDAQRILNFQNYQAKIGAVAVKPKNIIAEAEVERYPSHTNSIEDQFRNVIRSNLETKTKRHILRGMCDWVN